MSEPDINASLAARQRQVLDAVTGTAAIPDGFAAFNVDVARRALLDKRARELHYAWPILAASLGEHLRPLFAEFAEHRPTCGMRNDGYAFATWLEARGDLPLAGALELAEARLWWVWSDDDTPPQRRTSRIASARFPGGRLVRTGNRVHTIGRPRTS